MTLILPPLSKRYSGNKAFCLDTPELQVTNKTYTCIIGRNGSGKSSFAVALAESTHQDNWFYVPQYLERFLYAGNLREQLVAFFSSLFDEERIKTLLVDVGFVNPAELFDFPFILMSGGEKRRIALVCALYVQPDFLILDEPDIGVAEKESIAILSKINNLRANNTSLLLITHNPAYLKGSSDLICLENGQVDRAGETPELMNDPDFDYRQYGVRSQ